MTVAILSLVGTLLGALTALVGTALSDRRKERTAAADWTRGQRSAAYEGALRFLLRATNLPYEAVADDSEDAALRRYREWFSEIAEAQFWLQTLMARCGADQVSRLAEAAEALDTATAPSPDALVHRGKPADIIKVLKQCITVVTDCARLDMGQTAPLTTGTVMRIAARQAARQ